jgi:hypothetical protein
MSDAQLPPDTGDEESAPPLRWGTHLNDAGVLVAVRLDASDDAAPQDTPLPLPDAVEGEANESAPDVPVASVHAPANEAASDDVQPMLDLRLPDASSTAPSLDETLTLASQPIEDPHAAAFSDDHQGQGQRATTGDATAAADIPMEISPIFSALDAAERAAPPAVQGETAAEPDAFDTHILLPHSQLADSGDETTAPAAPLQAPEQPAIFPFEGDANPDAGVTIEIVASPEAAPQDTFVPPDAEQEALPAEALEDDAAARIAAEADATAAALENLKRLLLHRLPEPYIADTSNPQEAGPELAEPPPIPVYRPAVQLPVTPPPMIAAPIAATSLSYFEEDDAPPRRRWGAALGSFFAGFALSWVFGAVLYVYLTAG